MILKYKYNLLLLIGFMIFPNVISFGIHKVLILNPESDNHINEIAAIENEFRQKFLNMQAIRVHEHNEVTYNRHPGDNKFSTFDYIIKEKYISTESDFVELKILIYLKRFPNTPIQIIPSLININDPNWESQLSFAENEIINLTNNGIKYFLIPNFKDQIILTGETLGAKIEKGIKTEPNSCKKVCTIITPIGYDKDPYCLNIREHTPRKASFYIGTDINNTIDLKLNANKPTPTELTKFILALKAKLKAYYKIS